jgi:hypothetical protein
MGDKDRAPAKKAPMQMGRHWCPFGFGVGGQLGQDRDEPLSEGKLLQSQGSGRSTAKVDSQQQADRSF